MACSFSSKCARREMLMNCRSNGLALAPCCCTPPLGGAGTGIRFKPGPRGPFRVLNSSLQHGPKGRCGRGTCPVRANPYTRSRTHSAPSDGLTECSPKLDSSRTQVLDSKRSTFKRLLLQAGCAGGSIELLSLRGGYADGGVDFLTKMLCLSGKFFHRMNYEQ
jgi:hypothetical protein